MLHPSVVLVGDERVGKSYLATVLRNKQNGQPIPCVTYELRNDTNLAYNIKQLLSLTQATQVVFVFVSSSKSDVTAFKELAQRMVLPNVCFHSVGKTHDQNAEDCFRKEVLQLLQQIASTSPPTVVTPSANTASTSSTVVTPSTNTASTSSTVVGVRTINFADICSTLENAITDLSPVALTSSHFEGLPSNRQFSIYNYQVRTMNNICTTLQGIRDTLRNAGQTTDTTTNDDDASS